MDREAMKEALRYRARVASTVDVAVLLLHPPERAGAVLKVVRGLLFAHRGIRNVVDLRGEADDASKARPETDMCTFVVGGEMRWRVRTGSAACDHLKALLLDPAVLAASAARSAEESCAELFSIPLSAEANSRLGLPAALVERLTRAAAMEEGMDNETSKKKKKKKATMGDSTATAPLPPLRVGLATVPVSLTYENYTMAELLRMLLPSSQPQHQQGTSSTEEMRRFCGGESGGMNNSQSTTSDVVALSGFEQVGHIAHVNLSKAHLAFKYIIGQVILDCNPTVAVVVNKTDAISSQFREFPMEVVALRPELSDTARGGGLVSAAAMTEDELLTATVKQHGCVFDVPYNRVYWNSRLSHEHTRLVAMMAANDVLFDAMAGVGPFAIPAAKRGVLVFGNDLNPASAQFMAHNRDKNRIAADAVQVFNWDGRDFLNKVLYDCVMGLHALPPQGRGRKHVVMNLPATAVEFLDVFAPLQDNGDGEQMHEEEEEEGEKVQLPAPHGWYRRGRWNYRPASVPASAIDKSVLIHVYCFSPAVNALEEAVTQVERSLGYPLEESNKECVFMVRDVAPQKRMVCVSFTLPDTFWAHQVPIAVTGSLAADTKEKEMNGQQTPHLKLPRVE